MMLKRDEYIISAFNNMVDDIAISHAVCTNTQSNLVNTKLYTQLQNFISTVLVGYLHTMCMYISRKCRVLKKVS